MASSASPMLVLVALSGRSLRLDVHSGVRVDAVQQALLSFTGIPLADQLVMFNGARLDPARTLGSYGLPVPDPGMAEESPVFLYSRSFLKPGAKVPDPEVLPDITTALPPAPAALQLHHPLHSSPSPLVRGLPQLELQFQHDLAVAKAYWDTSQLRVQRCRQLLCEQEVQARAADAARTNVQVHFNHITTSYHTFLSKFSQQHAAHAELLESFESDLAQLARIQLHPGLQTRSGWRTLEDLTPVSKMRQWGDHCRRSHEHFGVKVAELGSLLQSLKQDVEGLLAQTPSVNLEQLGSELGRAEGAADELSLLVQALAKDLRSARELVERAVGELAAPTGGSRVQDECGAMQAIAEAHSTQMLPQARALDGTTAAFCTRCAEAKTAMTTDVVTQLQRISGQQSRIRDLKAKLAAFTEVLNRQELAFAELKMAHRIPTAYRMLLAECMRQAAWQELYSQQAVRLEEHLGKLRGKEAARRAHFLQQVERYLPNDAISQAGLTQEPPRCSLSITAQEQALLAVALSDLHAVPTRGHLGGRTPLSLPGGPGAGAGAAAALPSAQEMAVEMAYRGPTPASHSLELEVAMLKSELGSYIAAACMRELSASEGQPAAGAGAGVPSAHRAVGGSAAAAAPGSARAAHAGGSGPGSGSSSVYSASVPASLTSSGAALGPPPASGPSTSTQQVQGSLAAAAAGGGGGAGGGPGGQAAHTASTWAAPEELMESMRRALKLKDDLLDKLQAQVSGLRGECGEQQQRIQQLEARAAADAQALGVMQQQQQALMAQLVSQAAAGAGAAGGEAGQLQHQHQQPEAPGEGQQGPLQHGPSLHSHPQSGSGVFGGSHPCRVGSVGSMGSVGPSGSSPGAGPSLLAPQPLLLGPIALAALSACRPGSAGPTLCAATGAAGSGSGAAAAGAPSAFAGSVASHGGDAGDAVGAAGAAGMGMGPNGLPLPMLSTFSSAPLGSLRPGQRHSLGNLGDALLGLQQLQALQSGQQPGQQAHGHSQGHGQVQAVATAGEGVDVARHGQGQGQGQGVDRGTAEGEPPGELRQQGERERGQRRAGSASGEFSLMGGSFSLYDSLPAGAMDEVGGPGDSPMGRALGTASSGEGFGLRRLASRHSGDGFASGGLTSQRSGDGSGSVAGLGSRRSGGDTPGLPDPQPQFGSLPFASSLPRYGSLTSVAVAVGQSGRRPSEVLSASSSNLPNAVLASVMRVAGQEPEPLPWAHLRQSPPPTLPKPAVGTGAGREATGAGEPTGAGSVGSGAGTQEGDVQGGLAGQGHVRAQVPTAGGQRSATAGAGAEEGRQPGVAVQTGFVVAACLPERRGSPAGQQAAAAASHAEAEGSAPVVAVAHSQAPMSEPQPHSSEEHQGAANAPAGSEHDAALQDTLGEDDEDEDAPDLDDIMAGNDADSGLEASTFLTATCD